MEKAPLVRLCFRYMYGCPVEERLQDNRFVVLRISSSITASKRTSNRRFCIPTPLLRWSDLIED